MTIASETRLITYVGAGSTGPFSFSFKIFQAADLVVSIDGTVLDPSEYTLPASSINNENGGSITLDVALAVGETLTIERTLALIQPTDLKNQGNFFPTTHEAQFDRSVMIDQQINARVDDVVERVEDLEAGGGGGGGGGGPVAWDEVTGSPSEFTPAAHSADKITSGTIATARLGSGPLTARRSSVATRPMRCPLVEAVLRPMPEVPHAMTGNHRPPMGRSSSTAPRSNTKSMTPRSARGAHIPTPRFKRTMSSRSARSLASSMSPHRRRVPGVPSRRQPTPASRTSRGGGSGPHRTPMEHTCTLTKHASVANWTTDQWTTVAHTGTLTGTPTTTSLDDSTANFGTPNGSFVRMLDGPAAGEARGVVNASPSTRLNLGYAEKRKAVLEYVEALRTERTRFLARAEAAEQAVRKAAYHLGEASKTPDIHPEVKRLLAFHQNALEEMVP